jgi:hypothetical protein
MSSHQFRHFLGKALQAAEFGKQAWGPMSTGEKVSIALALDRADWLAAMGYDIPNAIDLAGDWVPLVPHVFRELKNQREEHWLGFK